MGVNNLPRVAAWQCTGRELNPGPLGLESNALTITPPSVVSWVYNVVCCGVICCSVMQCILWCDVTCEMVLCVVQPVHSHL